MLFVSDAAVLSSVKFVFNIINVPSDTVDDAYFVCFPFIVKSIVFPVPLIFPAVNSSSYNTCAFVTCVVFTTSGNFICNVGFS